MYPKRVVTSPPGRSSENLFSRTILVERTRTQRDSRVLDKERRRRERAVKIFGRRGPREDAPYASPSSGTMQMNDSAASPVFVN